MAGSRSPRRRKRQPASVRPPKYGKDYLSIDEFLNKESASSKQSSLSGSATRRASTPNITIRMPKAPKVVTKSVKSFTRKKGGKRKLVGLSILAVAYYGLGELMNGDIKPKKPAPVKLPVPPKLAHVVHIPGGKLAI